MPLQLISQMVSQARAGGYAIGYFESWNLESLQGVLDAAESSRSPIIVGFNGDFLARPGRLAAERLGLYGALGRAAASEASVPCGFIFNECPDDGWVRKAVLSGFNLVMPADPSAPFEESVRRVAFLTQFAHEHGVAVEAELGVLPCGTGGADDHGHEASLTDPDLAARFVEETGVDLLAVSVGNVHIRLEGRGGLDLERLGRIAGRVPCGLVLHGGTGIEPESLRLAVGLGVVKVNFGTYLKQRYLAAIRSALRSDCPDPHRLLGIGGDEDVMTAGRIAVRDAVLERIGTLGCAGRAT
ncbi:Fructose-bisphosphate aldolase [Aquisphaera giovannonii]|uniref:Fructose-bisphosphate aldolase n=1 Tax=Aquisphaera giovannonii TaxID=406548 RepID=A0A5B9W0J8_9BACT|nr:class II fructose-bisphosphate aldolase [Aquisphaera giovannonii]QEH33440.1 Fructose-bisphosphate aldolase [Aquisphaera giovannonii]